MHKLKYPPFRQFLYMSPIDMNKVPSMDVVPAREGIDVEPLREGRLIEFAKQNRIHVYKAVDYMKAHPWMTKVMIGAGTITGLTPAVAADSFGVNGTQIDEMFAILNENILPDVGGTIQALPAVIIPIVIIVVLIIVMLFVPELLYSLIGMLRDAMKFKR